MDLKNKKCVPCEGGALKMTKIEIERFKGQINPGWELAGSIKIKRGFNFVNFKHTMEFVNKVAALAEEEGHHPDMQVGYGYCVVELWTHAVNGLSENDFILAAKIDGIT
jgi:4a-hydroxytetrahydrobiopterin dehydratase